MTVGAVLLGKEEENSSKKVFEEKAMNRVTSFFPYGADLFIHSPQVVADVYSAAAATGEEPNSWKQDVCCCFALSFLRFHPYDSYASTVEPVLNVAAKLGKEEGFTFIERVRLSLWKTMNASLEESERVRKRQEMERNAQETETWSGTLRRRRPGAQSEPVRSLRVPRAPRLRAGARPVPRGVWKRSS